MTGHGDALHTSSDKMPIPSYVLQSHDGCGVQSKVKSGIGTVRPKMGVRYDIGNF